jgi:acyl-CoA thioesterase FadM
MFRIFRIFLAILMGFLKRPKGSPLEKYEIEIRVWPTDVDVGGVNQSLYLFYIELARWYWIFGSTLGVALKNLNCLPVTGTQVARHLKPLKRFEKIRVSTQLTHWDDKWLYLDQSIHRGTELVAVMSVKGLFKSKTGIVPTQKILDYCGSAMLSPPLPPRFLNLKAIEDDSVSVFKAK